MNRIIRHKYDQRFYNLLDERQKIIDKYNQLALHTQSFIERAKDQDKRQGKAKRKIESYTLEDLAESARQSGIDIIYEETSRQPRVEIISGIEVIY